MGQGAGEVRHGELVVDAPDDYHGLALKTKAAVTWALGTDADVVMVAFVDTYIDTVNLCDVLDPDVPYRGRRCDEGHAGGGYGYLLNRRACQVVSEASFSRGLDDIWVGNVMRDAGIGLVDDRRFGPPEECHNGSFTAHLSRGTGNYYPKWMRVFHGRLSAK